MHEENVGRIHFLEPLQRQLLRRSHKVPPAYYDLGLIAVAENDIKQALDYFEQAQKFGGERVRLDASDYLEKLRELNR